MITFPVFFFFFSFSGIVLHVLRERLSQGSVHLYVLGVSLANCWLMQREHTNLEKVFFSDVSSIRKVLQATCF